MHLHIYKGIKVSNCEHCSLDVRSGVVPTVTTPAPLSSLFICRLLFRNVSFKIIIIIRN